MKIAYISDIHLEHRDEHTRQVLQGNFEGLRQLGFPDKLDAEILIIAGDIHHISEVRASMQALLEDKYKIPVLLTLGNHDFYYRPFITNDQLVQLRLFKGVKIALAPLWTRLSPLDMVRASNFIDFKHIDGIDPHAWNEVHSAQLNGLASFEPDVIVTHHAPFAQSTSDGYQGDPGNCFFINTHIDPTSFPKTKLWIHGHVHQSWDYQLEHLRVVCNPKGYPFESRNDIGVKIVEIDV